MSIFLTVSAQLAKKTGISSQPETLLTFMLHLVGDQPECFVPENFEPVDVTSKGMPTIIINGLIYNYFIVILLL